MTKRTLDTNLSIDKMTADISRNGVFDMLHSLSNVCLFDGEENQDFVPVTKHEYIKDIFERVFYDLKDVDGNDLSGKAEFQEKYISTLEKCDIENTIDLIYKLIGKKIKLGSAIYYKDDMDAELPKDVVIVIEMIKHLHFHRVPKKFVAGFLLLMVRFIYFPLNN